jgi:hypothetical protein
MLPIVFEKTVLTATFEELWHGRWPDFRARNEKQNLTRQGIEVEFVNQNEKSTTVRAFAETVPQINYLVSRGYEKVRVSRPAKPVEEFSDAVRTILKRPRIGAGSGIPLTRGEVAMLFLDGYAGPGLLDIRSQGYGDDDLWDGLLPTMSSKTRTPPLSGQNGNH